jgi:hypothetical protein
MRYSEGANGSMTLTDREVASVLAHMQPETRALFDLLTVKLQEAYLYFWETRPDQHASHRDTLPAFIAGVLADR